MSTYTPTLSGAGPEDIQVVTKPDVRAIRTVRTELLRLAYAVSSSGRNRRAVLFLPNPKISDPRLSQEWRLAASALSREVINRLSIVVLRDGKIRGYPRPPDQALQARLEEIVRVQPGTSGTPLPPRMAHLEILKILLRNWLLAEDALTIQHLASAAGVSYPTVAAAIRKLGPAIERTGDRRVHLGEFPKTEWSQLIALSEKARGTLRYADRSGQPRSPISLLQRARKLEPAGVAVGGVFGAAHYYPDLDLVGSPRLDLTVHAPGSTIDHSFVHRLDPGLQHTQDPAEPANLVLHFLRRQDPYFEAGSAKLPWADLVECLLDLHEIPLESQAQALLAHLLAQRDARP